MRVGDSSHIFLVKFSKVTLDRSECLFETPNIDILKIRIDMRMKNPKAQNKMMTKM